MKESKFLKVSASELAQEHSFNGIDLIKFVCAYLVLTIHIQPFDGHATVYNEYMQCINFAMKNIVCRIAVPFFFIASGFLLFRKIDLENIDLKRIKGYCFKLIFLLGIWYFLLFVGRVELLWYLIAVVVAVVIITFLLKKGLSLGKISCIAAVTYAFGLLGDSYYGLVEPLKNYGFTNFIIKNYEIVSDTTRNGLYFGLLFVLLGVIFAHKRIAMNIYVAFIGFIVSFGLMFLEAYLLKHYSNPKEYNMYISLVPAAFFLFYIATHLNLKDRPIYKKLRTIGVLVFFSHVFINYFVVMFLAALEDVAHINLYSLHYILTLACTTVFAVLIERLSRKHKWLRYLYA